MTILLDDSPQFRWQTDFGRLLLPIKRQIEPLEWLVTDLQYHFIDDQLPRIVSAWETAELFVTVSGVALYQAVANRDIQVVWGVFCGVAGKVPDLSDDQVPYADGNRELWTEPEAFLLPQSEIEIVCFDSTVTLVKFRDEALGQQFLEVFPEGKTLRNSAVGE